MKRILAISLFCSLFISCKYGQSSNNSATTNKDQIALRLDSTERAHLFQALGDTVFGKVCYGMNKTQYQKAVNTFIKSLKGDAETCDFMFGGYGFDIDEYTQFEDVYSKNPTNIPNLEYYLNDQLTGTLFYKGRLISVQWHAYGNSNYHYQVTDKLSELFSYFEKKYGKPNVNNIENFDANNIEVGRSDRDKVIARWETDNRKIVIYYKEMTRGDRRIESSSLHYQYFLDVYFLDKERKHELNEFIKPVLNNLKEAEQEKKRQEKKNMENAL